MVAPIGVPYAWWRDAVVRVDRAGYSGVWTWDHFASRGTGRPSLEAWTSLATVAPLTRTVTLGTLVTNVMNRHPAVLARIAATLQDASRGRVVVGLGIGGDAAEHAAFGVDLPPAAERVRRLEETCVVLRALWSGERVDLAGEFWQLRGALGLPAPRPVPPIVVAGQTRTGARMAARAGDAWTTRPDLLEALLPVYRDARAVLGRGPGRVIVGFEGSRAGTSYVAGTAWQRDPAAELAAWRARGADEVVLTARTDADIDALEAMAAG
ncbi:MAG TPA: LLM class flavin-dependent oxidoreductase [Candidatus Limnocylindrales bacterium]|nr:LLM class flavin-dependent oxidoreductase [Candidatus Limnocylindrales bacterium]